MKKTKEKTPSLEEVFFPKLSLNLSRITSQAKDNIFCANHRNAMLQKYGFTEAMTITINDLI